MKNSNVPLTAGELAPLWSGYLGDSMAHAVLRHFQATVQDPDILRIVEYALGLTEEHITFKNKLFTEEGITIPVGFTDADVDLEAPRLFSDTLVLYYLRQMGLTGVPSYGLAMGSSFRNDIREFFNHNLKTAAELVNQSTTLLLERGQLTKTPVLPVSGKPEYVHKEGWLNGWFGDRRPVNAVEITHLHLNLLTNSIGKAIMIGFAQVANDKDVVKYTLRGRDLADNMIKVLGAYLQNDNLPVPATMEGEVTNSTRAPFSDKLMLFHTLFLASIGLGGMGNSMAGSPRRDLAAEYARMMPIVGTFADDGAELMIGRGWMEKIPGAIERDALIQQ